MSSPSSLSSLAGRQNRIIGIFISILMIGKDFHFQAGSGGQAVNIKLGRIFISKLMIWQSFLISRGSSVSRVSSLKSSSSLAAHEN